jgi:ligand-binding sensor domain-containing protein
MILKMKRFFPLIIFCIVVLPVSLFALEWQTFTNSNNITSFTRDGNGSYWVTSTGGVMRFDPETGSLFKYVNTNGLGGIDIRASAHGNSYVWFGSVDGKLSRFDPDENDWRQFLFIDRDGAPLEIKHLRADGDFLWVSHNVGLSLFDTERHEGEIKETYRRFGDISPGTGVNCMLTLNDTIWLATSMGIAYAPKSDPNLLDFTHWNSFNRDSLPELMSENFSGLFVHEDNVWGVLTEAIIEFERNGSQISIGEIIEIEHPVQSVVVSRDTLYIGSDGGRLYSWYDGATEQVQLELSPDSAVTALIADDTEGLILGTQGEGILARQNNGIWRSYRSPGPANNNMIDITASTDGTIWMVHDNDFVSLFDGDRWESVSLVEGRIESAEPDNEGNIWVGSFGSGAYELTESGAVNYDTTNTSLIGNRDDIPASLNFIVLPDMHFDVNGILWFACFRGHERRPISFYDPLSQEWEFYQYSGFNLDAKISSIYSDGSAVWAGFEDDGLYRINYGSDPFDKSDLEFKQYTRDSLLPSENVSVVTGDSKGIIYVGTDMGMAFKGPDDRFFSRILLPEGVAPQITKILFDQRGNLWVGTESGLAFRKAGQTSFEVYTTANSDIISDKINSLTIDNQRRLWVLTDAGISVLTYDIGAVTDVAEEVYAYPNPYILIEGGENLQFNYSGEVPIDIFSLDGRKIKTIFSNIGWNGTNENGEKVASGMYLFFIRDDNGNTHTGKIAVIRK